MSQQNPLLADLESLFDETSTNIMNLEIAEEPPNLGYASKANDSDIVNHRKQRQQAMKELIDRSKLDVVSEWKWSLSKKIGKSNFSVFREERNPLNQSGIWAVKRINKEMAGYDLPNGDILREISSFALLTQEKSAYFVEFFGWTEDAFNVYIAMECIEQGDLEMYIKGNKDKWVESEVGALAKQLLSGLELMHGHGIIHRDLKPANIFLITRSPIHVKIGDFGISKRLSFPGENNTIAKTSVGTFQYQAPETWGGNPYNFKADLWSLGCVLYRVIMGVDLYRMPDPMQYQDTWIQQQLAQIGSDYMTPNGGVDFMSKVIRAKPEVRLTTKEALEHPWIQAASNRIALAQSGGTVIEIAEGILKTTPKNDKKGGEQKITVEPLQEVTIDEGEQMTLLTGKIKTLTGKIKTLAENVTTLAEKVQNPEVESTEQTVQVIPVSNESLPIKIDFDVVHRLAANGENGEKELMRLLSRKSEDIMITQVAMATIVETFDLDVLMCLINSKANDITIDFTLVNGISSKKGSKKLMMALLNRRKEEVKITQIGAETIFEKFDKEVIASLIRVSGKDIPINWSLVNQIANKEESREVMMLFLDRPREEIVISDMAAETIFELFDDEVVACLFEKKGRDIRLTTQMRNAIKSGKYGGKFKDLLKH